MSISVIIQAMKKYIIKFITLTLMIAFSFLPLQAEPGYDDVGYWANKCGKPQVNANEYNACSAFRTHMANRSSDLSARLNGIASKRSEISANIDKYKHIISDYAKQNEVLQVKIKEITAKIDTLQAQIKDMQNSIEKLLCQIHEEEIKISQIKDKIKKRIVEKQATMRTNSIIDVILGAKSFDEVLRILSGLDTISKSDQKARDEFLQLVNELNYKKKELDKQKANLETAKTNLDGEKKELNKQSEKILALKYEAQLVQDEYEKQSAQLEAEGNRIASDIAAVRNTMANITLRLDHVPDSNPHSTPGAVVPPSTSSGWIRPVSGAYRSAGTWYYPGGGVHLGYDFAAAIGTPILAVGNGVVLKSANGCPTVGGLGSRCGSQFGGSTGGGNQVYLLTKINGNLYAIKYLHMMVNSPIATGTIVMAGQQIGRLGSSGNSSGPHCHVEIFYLGGANNFTAYAQNWNGDLSFGAGWGAAGIRSSCDHGNGAPCRLRPETIFGN